MATKKTKNKVDLISDKNDLIQQLEGSDYIKNPLVYSQIRGDFSLIQTNVLVAIAATMQDRINSKFENGVMGPLFTKEELSRGKITFEVPLASLGVKTKEYASVHESCRALTKLDTTFTYTDDSGEKRTKTSVIFTDVDVPTYVTSTGQTRRVGNIKIDMNASVAELIFNKSGAYVEHLEGIVRLCRSPRTPRLYIYLSAWKHQQSCTLNYLALKEFLGVLVYNKDRSKIVQDKCTTWAVFHRDVLDPAKKEMKRLADQGKVEFYFDYDPVYHNGRKRGNPDCVRFNLYPAEHFGHATEIEEKVTSSSTHLSPLQQQQWEQFCSVVKERCGEKFYEVFVTPCTLRESDDKWVVVNVPSKYVAEQWEKQGINLFSCIREVFGPSVRLSYKI